MQILLFTAVAHSSSRYRVAETPPKKGVTQLFSGLGHVGRPVGGVRDPPLAWNEDEPHLVHVKLLHFRSSPHICCPH
jgi:hypothetical protein